MLQNSHLISLGIAQKKSIMHDNFVNRSKQKYMQGSISKTAECKAILVDIFNFKGKLLSEKYMLCHFRLTSGN